MASADNRATIIEALEEALKSEKTSALDKIALGEKILEIEGKESLSLVVLSDDVKTIFGRLDDLEGSLRLQKELVEHIRDLLKVRSEVV